MALLVVGGCLSADPPDGEWRAMTNDCIPLAAEPTAILQNEPFLRSFAPAGDTIVFDDAEGLSQLSLLDGERLIAARINSDGAADFQRIENELVYYARNESGLRDLVVDRGAAVSPRWLTIGSVLPEDPTQLIADRAGVSWRAESDMKWNRWSRSTNALVSLGVPDDAKITTDGELLFYLARTDIDEDVNMNFPQSFFSLPVDGGTPTRIFFGDDLDIVGTTDSRFFIFRAGELFGAPTGLIEVVVDFEARTADEVGVAEVSAIGNPRRRALGGNHFYWTDVDSVLRVSLDGPTDQQEELVTTIADGEVGTVKTDACNVYWQVIHTGGTDLYARRH